MTDIHFQTGDVTLRLNLMEVDETDLSALRWAIDVRFGHPTGSFTYSADDIWLETKMWDEFVEALGNGARKRAQLYDQSEYFVLCIQRNDDGLQVQCSAFEPILPRGRMKFEIELQLDLDGAFVPNLFDSFRSFPVFW